MASDAQNTLYDIFAGLSQHSAGSVGSAFAAAIANAPTNTTAAVAKTPTNTAAAAKQSAKAGESSLANAGKGALKNSLGLAGLVLSLFGVFGGDEREDPPALVKYALPAAREFEAAEVGSGFGAIDYDQGGRPRAYNPKPSGAQQPQVNVTVQAMDARSFLDRSTEIAAAVRDAMLNLNSINDVVNDL